MLPSKREFPIYECCQLDHVRIRKCVVSDYISSAMPNSKYQIASADWNLLFYAFTGLE